MRRRRKGRRSSSTHTVMLLCIFAMVCLCGCRVIHIDTRKLQDLPYTIVDEYEIPEEMREEIQNQKEEAFIYTWADADSLYIARGYGRQQSAGYQIQVDAFYESEEVLVLVTTLLGPEPDTDTENGPRCPYLVIRTDYHSKHVITE